MRADGSWKKLEGGEKQQNPRQQEMQNGGTKPRCRDVLERLRNCEVAGVLMINWVHVGKLCAAVLCCGGALLVLDWLGLARLGLAGGLPLLRT
jgi:hypothetical protein